MVPVRPRMQPKHRRRGRQQRGSRQRRSRQRGRDRRAERQRCSRLRGREAESMEAERRGAESIGTPTVLYTTCLKHRHFTIRRSVSRRSRFGATSSTLTDSTPILTNALRYGNGFVAIATQCHRLQCRRCHRCVSAAPSMLTMPPMLSMISTLATLSILCHAIPVLATLSMLAMLARLSVQAVLSMPVPFVDAGRILTQLCRTVRGLILGRFTSTTELQAGF